MTVKLACVVQVTVPNVTRMVLFPSAGTEVGLTVTGTTEPAMRPIALRVATPTPTPAAPPTLRVTVEVPEVLLVRTCPPLRSSAQAPVIGNAVTVQVSVRLPFDATGPPTVIPADGASVGSTVHEYPAAA